MKEKVHKRSSNELRSQKDGNHQKCVCRNTHFAGPTIVVTS
jgi:hypothetical protein